jgi:hypothetical protein
MVLLLQRFGIMAFLDDVDWMKRAARIGIAGLADPMRREAAVPVRQIETITLPDLDVDLEWFTDDGDSADGVSSDWDGGSGGNYV